MNVTVLCVGKIKEKYFTDAINEYEKRLTRYGKVNIVEIPECKICDKPSEGDIAKTVTDESERLILKIPKGNFVFTMCIEGKHLSSEGLAEQFKVAEEKGCSGLTFIIGGSWGLSDKIKKLADFRLSMSEMTFPHQMARVMVLEQVYRGFQINTGGKYHK